MTSTLEIDGHPLRILEQPGDAPAVVMIHSSGLGARQWTGWLRALHGRACVAPNLTGYDEDPAALAARALDWRHDLHALHALLDRLDHPVDLLGHSYGGYLALLLALERPEAVRRLALHEPVAWGLLRAAGTPEESQGLDALMARLYAPDVPPGGQTWLEGFLAFWNGPGAWDTLPPSRQRHWLGIGPKVAAEVRAVGADATTPQQVAALPHPTLITMGVDSPVWERRVCQIMAQAMPEASLHEVPGGHMAPLTHLQDTLAVHLPFLEKTNQQRKI